jgi:hypothetical protein
MGYRRVPLDTSQAIRLLRYSDRSNSECLACTLESASMNEAYHALSCVWRSATSSSLIPISCNGDLVHVTVNLFDAESDVATIS